jgi:hypothetical protein
MITVHDLKKLCQNYVAGGLIRVYLDLRRWLFKLPRPFSRVDGDQLPGSGFKPNCKKILPLGFSPFG